MEQELTKKKVGRPKKSEEEKKAVRNECFKRWYENHKEDAQRYNRERAKILREQAKNYKLLLEKKHMEIEV